MRSAESLGGGRCLAVGMLIMAHATAMAGPAPVLKVDAVSSAGDTGTYHYVDELRLSVGGSAPLMLRSDVKNDRLVPIPGPQYPIGDEHVLLLGWSSYGGGMETIHALLLHVEDHRVILHRELLLTTARTDSVLLIRRDAPDTVLLGIPEWSGGRLHEEDEWALVLGPAKAEHLDAGQVRSLPFVAVTRRTTDLLYAPPFQAAPYPPRVTWLAVSTKGFALSTRTR
jgi:hypothetical protein